MALKQYSQSLNVQEMARILPNILEINRREFDFLLAAMKGHDDPVHLRLVQRDDADVAGF